MPNLKNLIKDTSVNCVVDTKYDIFLSYSRADEKVVSGIYRELINAGFTVFYDREAIGAEQFPKAIANGILSSKLFLFIASANSVKSNYAPDEITFAKGRKARNAIIVYRIDSCTFPTDIELLFSSLNHRDASVDSMKVIIDDCNQLLSQGEISRIPKVSKETQEDSSLEHLLSCYESLNFYQVIYQELKNEFWRNNWNHHLLLMMSYKMIGDRVNYAILLEQYYKSGIVFYPDWYEINSQIWDMIQLGFPQIALSHYQNIPKQNLSHVSKICLQVNRSHILFCEGRFQDALNNYRDIIKGLNQSERYSLVIKDFNTLRWLGNYQLSNQLLETITEHLGYQPQEFYTSPQVNDSSDHILKELESHTWHLRENRTHISLSFQCFNGVTNSIYYFEEFSKNFFGKLFGTLPFGIDESQQILKSGRAFCQYRLNIVNDHCFIEEYDPIREIVSCGEIIKLDKSDLYIRIINNGDPAMTGVVRKYKSK